MKTAVVVFVCDRCGRNIMRDADTKGAEEQLPMRWRLINVKGSDEQPAQRHEVCAACFDSFSAFMRNVTARASDYRPQDQAWPLPNTDEAAG